MDWKNYIAHMTAAPAPVKLIFYNVMWGKINEPAPQFGLPSNPNPPTLGVERTIRRLRKDVGGCSLCSDCQKPFVHNTHIHPTTHPRKSGHNNKRANFLTRLLCPCPKRHIRPGRMVIEGGAGGGGNGKDNPNYRRPHRRRRGMQHLGVLKQ